MNKIKEKIQRNELLISVRTNLLNQEALKLKDIRSVKIDLVNRLKTFQKQYLDGVDLLNNERQSSQRQRLATLEASIDRSKDQWYQCLSELKEVEEKEKKQINMVLDARTKLRSIEIMQEKEEQNLANLKRKIEQKEQDELAGQSFSRRQR